MIHTDAAKKIAVFRALPLGDLLCSMPAMKKLKRAFPDANLYLIGLPTMEHLIRRFKFIDHFITFPGCQGLPEQESTAEETERFVEKLCRLDLDILIQMHGNGTIINDLLARCEAKKLIAYCPDAFLTGQDTLIYPDGIHEIHRNLDLLKLLGLVRNAEDDRIPFPIHKTEIDSGYALLNDYGVFQFAVIHVGSGDPIHQWELSYFAVLAELLIKDGLRIVLSGTAMDSERVTQMKRLLGERAINLCGKTDLGTFDAILQRARLLLCNCISVSHIAAALDVPSVVISMDGELERWAPLDHTRHRIFDGTKDISLHTVAQAMQSLLARSAASGDRL